MGLLEVVSESTRRRSSPPSAWRSRRSRAPARPWASRCRSPTRSALADRVVSDELKGACCRAPAGRLGGFRLTEPGSGSDAARCVRPRGVMQHLGDRRRQGLITNAGRAGSSSPRPIRRGQRGIRPSRSRRRLASVGAPRKLASALADGAGRSPTAGSRREPAGAIGQGSKTFWRPSITARIAAQAVGIHRWRRARHRLRPGRSSSASRSPSTRRSVPRRHGD
jgi:hypothetical protein